MNEIVQYQNFRYRLLNENEAELISAWPAKGKVTIPSKIKVSGKDYTVTSLGVSEKFPYASYDWVEDKRTKTGWRLENVKKFEISFGIFETIERNPDVPDTYRPTKRWEENGNVIDSITFPDTIKTVKRHSLVINQDKRIKLVLPEGVETIEGLITNHNDVSELHIPSTVKKIPDWVCWMVSSKSAQEKVISHIKEFGVWPSDIFSLTLKSQIIIHNDEGCVDVSPFNMPVKYVGKPSFFSKIFHKG